MKATIHPYTGNADIFYGDIVNKTVQWYGLIWDNEQEWDEWADDVLADIAEAENYDDIKLVLHMHTMHLIKN